MAQNSLSASKPKNSKSTIPLSEHKCFNDPIHGHIKLHPLLVKVIDTPQFQRMRNIKQLGGVYFVYPGASHNRFEHSIGTCYLAGLVARHLKSEHPELVDDKDVLCVELAGLCHDLGHGPYSHMFDMMFLPKVNRESKWTHEEGSCTMIDHLIDDNNLEGEFKRYGLSFPKDLDFIKEMISGPLVAEIEGWKYKGRPREKSFLYEIVSNERNKVDVDKWDYFARDCHHLGIKNSFDHGRFLQFLKVITVDGVPQICVRDKECFNLYEMFHTRSGLHRRAYQHVVCKAVEYMICDAMELANDYIKFQGKGEKLKISETMNDPVAYEKLTDHIFYMILYSEDQCQKMKDARKILNRVLQRDLYRSLGNTKLPKDTSDKTSFADCLEMQKEIASYNDELKPDDVIVHVRKFNYGMKKGNPCDNFRFYSKNKPNEPFKITSIEVSHMLPQTFQDREILVYCKHPKTSEKCKIAFECLKKWCKDKKHNLADPLYDSDETQEQESLDDEAAHQPML